jgi:hypothetical protein
MTTEHTVVSFRQIKKKAVQFKSGRPLGNYRDPCLQYPRVSSDTPSFAAFTAVAPGVRFNAFSHGNYGFAMQLRPS